jgi:hypothetical protein
VIVTAGAPAFVTATPEAPTATVVDAGCAFAADAGGVPVAVAAAVAVVWLDEAAGSGSRFSLSQAHVATAAHATRMMDRMDTSDDGCRQSIASLCNKVHAVREAAPNARAGASSTTRIGP